MRWPKVVSLGLTDRCNMRPPCVMCSQMRQRLDGTVPTQDMPDGMLEKMKPFFVAAKNIRLHGTGEPLLASDKLFRILSWLPEGERAKVAFNSNGLLLTEDLARRIVDSQKVRNINFSLDAATEETYQKIRHQSFKKVIMNIDRLVELRGEAPYPQVRINMTVMRANMHEIPDFVRLGAWLGASQVALNHMGDLDRDWEYDWFVYSEQHCSLEPERHDAFMEEAAAVAKSLGQKMVFPGTMYTQPKPREKYVPGGPLRCPHLEGRILVKPTSLTVRSCCWQRKSFGSLKKDSLEDIWFKRIAEAKKKARQGELPEQCRGAECYVLGTKP